MKYLYVAMAPLIRGINGVIVNLIPLNAYGIAFFRVLFASLTLLPLVATTNRIERTEIAEFEEQALLRSFTRSRLGFLFQ